MGAGANTILVVDDQDGVRQLLYALLSSEGFQVATAGNGYEVLEYFEAFSPELLIIDMKMPGMSGLDVLKELKNREQHCVPIMMTAYGELEIIKEAMELGVNYFINKPFDIDRLRQFIKKVLKDV